MSYVMALEGPALDERWFGVRKGPTPQVQFFGLNAINVPLTLTGVTMMMLGGVVFGFWLSGTSSGQRITRRVTGRMRAR